MDDDDQPSTSTAGRDVIPTRICYLDRIVHCLRKGHCCVVEGPVGCGKTYLAETAVTAYIAAEQLLQATALKLQLGDQIDSKVRLFFTLEAVMFCISYWALFIV